MSTSGKPWWRVLGSVAVAAALASAGCSQRTDQEDLQDDAATTEVAADTTDPLHVPNDSTLQKVQKISLRVTGNNLEEMKFDRDTIEVMAGALVKLSLINEGTEQSMIHNIVITGDGLYRQAAMEGAKAGAPGNYTPIGVPVLAASSLALPGQTVELEFQAPLNPAIYDFVCTYPEHYGQMHGKLIIK